MGKLMADAESKAPGLPLEKGREVSAAVVEEADEIALNFKQGKHLRQLFAGIIIKSSEPISGLNYWLWKVAIWLST